MTKSENREWAYYVMYNLQPISYWWKSMINVIREQRCVSFHSCVLHSLSSFLLTLHHTGIHVSSGFHIPMPSFPRFCLASFFICAVESVWVFFHLSFTFPDSDILNSVTLALLISILLSRMRKTITELYRNVHVLYFLSIYGM